MDKNQVAIKVNDVEQKLYNHMCEHVWGIWGRFQSLRETEGRFGDVIIAFYHNCQKETGEA